MSKSSFPGLRSSHRTDNQSRKPVLQVRFRAIAVFLRLMSCCSLTISVCAPTGVSGSERIYDRTDGNGRITFASLDGGTRFQGRPQAIAQVEVLQNHAGLHRWHLVDISSALLQLHVTDNYLACASLLCHVVAQQHRSTNNGDRSMLMVYASQFHPDFERMVNGMVSSEGALC